MELDTAFWTRHYDIMRRQEADLVEILSRVHFYYQCLPEYNSYLDERTLLQSTTPEEQQCILEATKAIDTQSRLNQGNIFTTAIIL